MTRFLWLVYAVANHMVVSAETTTGYKLDGKSPMCWENKSGKHFKCPEGLKLEFTDSSGIEAAVPLKEAMGSFAVILPPKLVLEGITMSRAPIGNYDIYHSNFHACGGGIFCTPIIKSNQGLLTSSVEQSANLDTRDRAEFNQEVTFPEPGLYQVIAHVQFGLDTNLEGETEGGPFLYDAASAISLSVTPDGQTTGTGSDDSSSSSGAIIGVNIGIIVVIAAVVGFILVRRKKSQSQVGGSNSSQQHPQIVYDQITSPDDNVQKTTYFPPPYESQAMDRNNATLSDNTHQIMKRQAMATNMDASARSAPGGTATTYFGSGTTTGTASYKSSGSSNAHEFVRNRPTEDADLHDMLYSNDTFKRCNIDSSKIIIYNVIGAGSFGEVLRGEYSACNVAIKRMHAFMAAKEADGFVGEIRLLMTLRHPNIVQFIGTSWIQGFGLCAVTEYMDRGDLTTVLESAKDLGLTWGNSKMGMATDSAKGLAYLHGLDPVVIHRDLKSRNVLVATNYTAKLSDFGLSRAVSTTSTMTVVGSNLWLAPEMIRGEKFTEKADVFSFGVVLTEFDTEKLPYHDLVTADGSRLTGVALAHQVAYKGRRPGFSAACHPGVRDLAMRCMDADPSRRPTAVEILCVLRGIPVNELND